MLIFDIRQQRARTSTFFHATPVRLVRVLGTYSTDHIVIDLFILDNMRAKKIQTKK